MDHWHCTLRVRYNRIGLFGERASRQQSWESTRADTEEEARDLMGQAVAQLLAAHRYAVDLDAEDGCYLYRLHSWTGTGHSFTPQPVVERWFIAVSRCTRLPCPESDRSWAASDVSGAAPWEE